LLSGARVPLAGRAQEDRDKYFLSTETLLISGEIYPFALHNVKRGPYKVNPLPYIIRFFRKALTATHISQILRKASAIADCFFADCYKP
jgi:hypothetical protein